MRSVEELEQELTESEAHLEGLEQTLAGSRVADLTELVTKGGKMRGHLTGLTPRQYEKVIGKKAPPGLLVKARDATTRKVQWDMVLDQLTSERGYQSDEQLRDAIEKAHGDKQEIEKAKATQGALRNEIIDRMKAEPEVETIKLDDKCPQFPDSTCTAEVTMVDGMRFQLRRQHSYWRLDTDKGQVIKIRYAKDARKLARVATKDYKESITEGRARLARERKELIKKLRRERRELFRSRTTPRITPRTPKLRR